MVSFAKEVNSRLAKCRLVFNGCLANHGITPLVKEATESLEYALKTAVQMTAFNTFNEDVDFLVILHYLVM